MILPAEASALIMAGAIRSGNEDEYNQKSSKNKRRQKGMHALYGLSSELAEIEEICEGVWTGNRRVLSFFPGVWHHRKTHLMYALGKGYGHTLIVLSSEDKAKKLYEEYRF
ncbi:MAG: hypothetical protein ACLR2O_05400 [Coprococcus sp.]